MATFLWFLFGFIYFVVLCTVGLMTLRKGHLLLFFLGFFMPLLWLIGALIGPTPRAASA